MANEKMTEAGAMDAKQKALMIKLASTAGAGALGAWAGYALAKKMGKSKPVFALLGAAALAGIAFAGVHYGMDTTSAFDGTRRKTGKKPGSVQKQVGTNCIWVTESQFNSAGQWIGNHEVKYCRDKSGNYSAT